MAIEIAAGPTNTVVIDQQKNYWMAGKVCQLTTSYFPPLTGMLCIVEEHWRWYPLLFACHPTARVLIEHRFRWSTVLYPAILPRDYVRCTP